MVHWVQYPFVTFPNQHFSVVILGAGVSGLSAARQFTRHQTDCCILEASSQVGGLASTHRTEGFSLDFGPHTFLTDQPEAQATFFDLFPQAAGRPLTRKVEFFYQGRFLKYPLEPLDLFLHMGWISFWKTCLSFALSRFRSASQESSSTPTVKDWAVARFGGHLYQTFFKPYTEQFWLRPCEELSARSIPSHTQTSFLNSLRLLLTAKISKSGSSVPEREKLPTYYPPSGYGELPEALAGLVKKAGVPIYLRSKVLNIEQNLSGWNITFTSPEGNQTLSADHLISTIPIPAFFKLLAPAVPPDTIRDSAARLVYRPLLVLGVKTQRQNVLRGSMYTYFLNRPYNRVFETTKFSPNTAPAGWNLLGLEIPCHVGDSTWTASPQSLFERCIPALERDDFLSRKDAEPFCLIRSAYAYPVYTRDYQKDLMNVMAWVNKQKNLYLLGRTGEFRYMDADQCMLRGFQLADQIHTRCPEGVHDLI